MYLARDIPAFVMYYVSVESRSSLLIESTDFIILLLILLLSSEDLAQLCRAVGTGAAGPAAAGPIFSAPTPKNNGWK